MDYPNLKLMSQQDLVRILAIYVRAGEKPDDFSHAAAQELASRKTPPNVLDLQIPHNDSQTTNVRAYLKCLLETLWIEEEGFSGKRPFGNSGWKYDLYLPLIQANFINGSIDEDGQVQECDSQAADNLILEAIRSLS